jgi:hypothetical protein
VFPEKIKVPFSVWEKTHCDKNKRTTTNFFILYGLDVGAKIRLLNKNEGNELLCFLKVD